VLGHENDPGGRFQTLSDETSTEFSAVLLEADVTEEQVHVSLADCSLGLGGGLHPDEVMPLHLEFEFQDPADHRLILGEN
jgi:hypothetical protein